MSDSDFRTEEVQLATRNHGTPLEALRYDLTPLGMHYLLTHFDVPHVDADRWSLRIDGHVDRTLSLSLDDIRARPRVTLPVTLECAGNGRARGMYPRAISQPWLEEAVGTHAWTGTPLAPILREAGIRDGAVDVMFGGADRGIQGEMEQWYERALTPEQAMHEQAILAYEHNGVPLLPQHGAPLRLIVPGWYGMASVKWLRHITVMDTPYWGYQQHVCYRVTQSEDDPGELVTRMEPRALMVAPGIPDFLSRERSMPPGRVTLRGRAWSGWAPITQVEVSTDGGSSWSDAALDPAVAEHAWCGWSCPWDAEEGRFELLCRATDGAGKTQPLEPVWNLRGVVNNAVQRIIVNVRDGVEA